MDAALSLRLPIRREPFVPSRRRRADPVRALHWRREARRILPWRLQHHDVGCTVAGGLWTRQLQPAVLLHETAARGTEPEGQRDEDVHQD